MSTVDAAMRTVHLSIIALWVGGVSFVTLAVLPVARDGAADAAPVERILGRLRTVSRASALLSLLTGGYLALVGVGYTVGTLAGTTRGRLVLAMVALWLLFAALVEVGVARTVAGLREKRVRAPAREGLRWFRPAALVGIALLVGVGLLATV